MSIAQAACTDCYPDEHTINQKRRPFGLRYLFSLSQRLIAFCRQVNRVALGR